MDKVIEIIGIILLDTLFSILNNKKINKYLRYIIFSIIAIFYVFVILMLFILGFKTLEKSIFAGLFLMCTSLFIVYSIIIIIKKMF